MRTVFTFGSNFGRFGKDSGVRDVLRGACLESGRFFSLGCIWGEFGEDSEVREVLQGAFLELGRFLDWGTIWEGNLPCTS